MKKGKRYEVLFRDSIVDDSGFLHEDIWRKKTAESFRGYILLLIMAFFNNNMNKLLVTMGLFLVFETTCAFIWIFKNFWNEFVSYHQSSWYLVISFLLLIILPLFLFILDRKDKYGWS